MVMKDNGIVGLKNLQFLSLGNVSIHDGSALLQSLGSLPYLKRLDLSYNNFSGNIMSTREFHNFTNLEELTMRGASLHTSFLQSIVAFTSLERLIMEDCQFNDIIGTKDNGIVGLKNLQFLSLRNVSILDGSTLLQSLGSLPYLKRLDLSYNNFSGNIMSTQELHNFTNLEELTMQGASLHTSLLQSIAAFASLKTLDMSDCQLNGIIGTKDLFKKKKKRYQIWFRTRNGDDGDRKRYQAGGRPVSPSPASDGAPYLLKMELSRVHPPRVRWCRESIRRHQMEHCVVWPEREKNVGAEKSVMCESLVMILKNKEDFDDVEFWVMIGSFEADGSPIYTDKIRGHFIWDVDPNMCDADCICRRCIKDTSPRSYKSWPKPHKPGHPDSPWIGLHHIKKKPLPIYDRALQILRSEGLLPPQPVYTAPTLPPPVPCYMTSDYDCDFPPLEPSSNQEKTRFSKPFVQSTEVQPDGSFKQPSQAEQVLNWQSHNARAQNRVLNSIDQKIDRVTRHVSQRDHHLQSLNATFRDLASDLQSRITKLHSDLHKYISHGYSGPDFDTKEREIKQLKAQLEQLTRDHSREHSSKPKPYSHQSLFFPVSPTHSPSSKPDDFSSHFKSTGELFRRYPVLSSPPAKQKKRSPSKQKDKQAASSSYNPVLFAFKVSSSSSKSDSASKDVSSQLSQTSCRSSWLDTANSSPHDHADLT
ncbi:hypothetical protein Q3G72_033021 [Acer saccharum]|nr:hypothetical protein Q3G72_033021 [Acer saccharum]